MKTAEAHRRYVSLWSVGATLPAGTIKTDSLPDSVWNPWPRRVQSLLERCDVDLFTRIEHVNGPAYLRDLRISVDTLVKFRNEVSHGNEPTPWTAADVRLRMKWAARLARACDEALGEKLEGIVGQGW